MLNLILALIDNAQVMAADVTMSDSFARGMLAGALSELAIVVEHASDEEAAAEAAIAADEAAEPVVQ